MVGIGIDQTRERLVVMLTARQCEAGDLTVLVIPWDGRPDLTLLPLPHLTLLLL